MWAPRFRSGTSEPVIAVCFARACNFEDVVADFERDCSIAVQFRGSQQGFQYGLLLAHDFLHSKKRTICFVQPARAGKTWHFEFARYPAHFSLRG